MAWVRSFLSRGHMELQDRSDVWRPPVAPDPTAAAALEQRRSELNYMPRRGFIRDLKRKSACHNSSN